MVDADETLPVRQAMGRCGNASIATEPSGLAVEVAKGRTLAGLVTLAAVIALPGLFDGQHAAHASRPSGAAPVHRVYDLASAVRSALAMTKSQAYSAGRNEWNGLGSNRPA
ncbi:MAG: hypothetical protein JO110_01540 [Acetobacteraceae bacterium]|nr:hypothetical protein [Acetobacteraceae bacterium]